VRVAGADDTDCVLYRKMAQIEEIHSHFAGKIGKISRANEEAGHGVRRDDFFR
jgi:hypothetical protein